MAELKNYYMAVESRGGVWTGEDEIAYLSDKSGVSQIWKISLSDRTPRQLTFYKERIWRLAAAANGKDLLFATDLGGNEPGRQLSLLSGRYQRSLRYSLFFLQSER